MVERHWRFLRAEPDSGLVNLADDPRLSLLAACVANQCTYAGFGRQGVIDARQSACPDCGAPGFNTGMGVWVFTCGAERLSDGDPAEPCPKAKPG
jgi:hypothetical protein